MMKTLTRLRNLWRDRRGNVLIIAGAGLPLLIGAAGLGVDTFALSVLKRQLQRAADSGALAAAYAKNQGTDLEDAVDKDNDINQIVGRLKGTPVIELSPDYGTVVDDADAVRVRLSADGYSPFIKFFLNRTIELNVSAVAKVDFTGEYCVVALDDSSDTGITLIGTTEVTLGCGMATNSNGTDAITANGDSKIVDADPLAAVGYIPPNDDNFTGTTTVRSYQPTQKDPLADLLEPDDSICSSPVNPAADFSNVVSGGCYTDFNVNSAITLPAGTYYVAGNITVNGGGTLNGTGVTLVMTGSTSDFKLNGGGKVILSAPVEGSGQPYIGTAIYRSRDADNRIITFNGNGEFTVQGNVYMPTADVTFDGGGASVSTCLQIVANKFKFSGNSTIKNDCPAGSGVEKLKGTIVRLVW